MTQHKKTSAFIAYSSSPKEIGSTIEACNSSTRLAHSFHSIETWKQLNVAGSFIADEVLSKIDNMEVFVADITTLNFNVTYELGYAIGKKKKIRLILNNTINNSYRRDLNRIGIFDTLGYEEYQNLDGLCKILHNVHDARVHNISHEINLKAPVYYVDAEQQNDYIVTIKSRIKKTGFFYRSFDPSESPRMSPHDAIRNVAESVGVIVVFLSDVYTDSIIHNQRAAFVAGLSAGMGKETLLLQLGDSPVPIDYRDLVTTVQIPDDIIDAVASFAPKVTLAMQNQEVVIKDAKASLLERINLGASAAENEFRDLGMYYLKTDAFKRALDGEVRIVLGRKGAGKTALFSQVRDRKRQDKNNVVIDLKPETYKLMKFKDEVLALLEDGTLEHTIMAFWEYILYLELCYKVLEKDEAMHLRDQSLYEPYKKLYALYHSERYISEGDLSERMTNLLQDIKNGFNEFFGSHSETRLTRDQVTELVYRHQLKDLRDHLIEYLRFKGEVVILIDNLDKGWNTSGVTKEDLMILRTLLDASRKIENHLDKKDIACHTLIFLRNDIYELLLNAISDRGKEPKALLDWTDEKALKEMIRKRLVSTEGIADKTDFEVLWRQIAESHVRGEESFNYLIERCLMRPRVLIDIIKSCRSIAINRGSTLITEDDILVGTKSHSRNLIEEINLEIRDAFPKAEDILYNFIAQKQMLNREDVFTIFLDSGVDSIEDWSKLLDILLWYGVLGLVDESGEVIYIYNISYEMKLLHARIKRIEINSKNVIFSMNPAFWGALSTLND